MVQFGMDYSSAVATRCRSLKEMMVLWSGMCVAFCRGSGAVRSSVARFLRAYGHLADRVTS